MGGETPPTREGVPENTTLFGVFSNHKRVFFRLSTAGGENFSTFWVCFCVFTTKNNVFLKDFTAKILKNFPPPAVILEFLPPPVVSDRPPTGGGGIKSRGG